MDGGISSRIEREEAVESEEMRALRARVAALERGAAYGEGTGGAEQGILPLGLAAIDRTPRDLSLPDRARTGAIPARGEIVMVVRGCVTGTADEDMTDSILRAMLDEGVTVRQTAAVAARLTGQSRNVLYRRALELAASRVRE